MSRVFFISDTHFGHRNLAENVRKMSVDEMDKLIITNWNKVINKKDIVYHLGDIVMEKPSLIKQYLEQLNGNIRVVGGNHDLLGCTNILKEMNIPIVGCFNYKGFIVTHIPVHPMEVNGFFRGNIHGHVHNVKTIYGKDYLNVACEFINYTPIEFTQLLTKYGFI